MTDGLYNDSDGYLWYVHEGEGQAVDWVEGIGPLVPEVALRMIFGPMTRINDETTRETA